MDIRAIFEEIRTLYFPLWDARREWAVAFGDHDQCHNNTGYCDSKAKTIYLDKRALIIMPDVGIRSFIIHEICHDVGAAGHNRRWAQRMERAALCAEKLSETEIARILRSDIYSYLGNGAFATYDLYSVLEFAVELIGNNPSMDYSIMVQRIAKYFGIAPVKIKRDFGHVINDVLAGII